MTCINDYDQVSPVYKGIRKKDKGFVDVTKGVNSVQGSTLLVQRMAAGFYSLVAACCKWPGCICRVRLVLRQW